MKRNSLKNNSYLTKSSVGLREKFLEYKRAELSEEAYVEYLIELEAEFAGLHTAVFHDGLTEVRNRRAYEALIRENFNYSSMAVVYCDVVELKLLNDTKGHAFSDVLLRTYADVLASFFSKEDVYRLGGDEFVVIVFDISERELDEKLSLLKKELAKSSGSRKNPLSFGKVWLSGENISIDEAVDMAERLMYTARS